MREGVELVALLGEEFGYLGLGRFDDPFHFLVDALLCSLRGFGDAGKESVLRLGGEQGDRADRVAHAPTSDHLAGDLGQLLDVRLGAGCRVAVDEPFGDAAAEGDLDLRLQVALVVAEAVDRRGGEGDAERHPARDDRDLTDRVGARREHPDDRVAGLVVGGALTIGGAEHDLPFGAEHDLLQRVGEVGHLHIRVFSARGEQGGFVGEVGEVGADHAGGGRGERVEVDVVGERHAAGVHLQDQLPSESVGRLDGDTTVEAAGPQQRRVEHVGTVGGS